jgi:hypothetical protein
MPLEHIGGDLFATRAIPSVTGWVIAGLSESLVIKKYQPVFQVTSVREQWIRILA